MANGKWYSTHNYEDTSDRTQYTEYGSHWSYIDPAHLNNNRSKIAVYVNNTSTTQFVTTFTMYAATGNGNFTWGNPINGNGGTLILQASAGGTSFDTGIKSDQRSGPDGKDAFSKAGGLSGSGGVYANTDKCELTTFTFEEAIQVDPGNTLNIYLNVVGGTGNCLVAKRNNADYGGNVQSTPPVVTYTVTFNNNGFGPDTYSIVVEANSSITFPEYDIYTMDHHKIHFNAKGGVAHDDYLWAQEQRALISWSEKETGEQYTGGVSTYIVTKDVTFYAYWEWPTLLKLALPTAERSGYTLVGWSTSSSATTADAGAPNTYYQPKDVESETLYAVWEPEKTTLYIDLNGGTWDGGATEISQKPGTTYRIPDEPIREGWDFTGWEHTGGGTLNETSTTFLFGNENGYLEASWQPRPDTKYTVNHWKINVGAPYIPTFPNDNHFTLVDSEIKIGTTNSTPSYSTHTDYAPGFNVDTVIVCGETSAILIDNIKIKGDGSTVVNCIYARNSFNVTLDRRNGIDTFNTDGSDYRYETPITVNATPAVGYDLDGWSYTPTTLAVTENNGDTQQTLSFNMPAENVVVAALAKPSTDTKFTIHHYLKDLNDTTYTKQIDATDIKSGTTNATITVADYKKDFIGFEYEFGKVNNTTTTTTSILADGSLVIDLYYRRKTDIKYTVQHYGKVVGENTYTLLETEEKSGTTGELIQIENVYKSFPGFTFKFSNPSGPAEIKGDGSLIISLYYDRRYYSVTITRDNGINSIEGEGEYEYEALVTVKATAKSGYNWMHWMDRGVSYTESTYNFTMPAESITLTANTALINYALTYEDAGWEYETGHINPTTYNIETPTFTLYNPKDDNVKTFKGWIINHSGEPQMTVTIPQGSTGDMTFSTKADYKGLINIFVNDTWKKAQVYICQDNKQWKRAMPFICVDNNKTWKRITSK